MTKIEKSYVIDTNVILEDDNFYLKYNDGTIIIPFQVLEELDTFKTRMDLTGRNARGFIRFLDKLREENGDITRHVQIPGTQGYLRIKRFQTGDIPYELNSNAIADNIILGVAINEQRKGRIVKVISNDTVVRVKAASLDIDAEGHIEDEVVTSKDRLYSGHSSLVINDFELDMFYNGEPIYLDKDDGEFFPNEFIILQSIIDPKKTALSIFKGYDKPLKKAVTKFNSKLNIGARNKEQIYALNLLLDPNIKLVSLIGTAGSGKTLLSVASGFHQVDHTKFRQADKKYISKKLKSDGGTFYEKLIVSRPLQALSKDIGYLPGSEKEKMLPWIRPILDSFEYLFGGDELYLSMIMDSPIVKIEAPTFIRGRTFPNCFIIIDEAQNITKHEIKTILTRVGEGSKIILTGDIEQIDNRNINEVSNGLSHVVEKFKKYDIAGHVTLRRGERSDIASLAAQIL